MDIEDIQQRIAMKLAMKPHGNEAAARMLLREYEQAVAMHRSAPPCIVCGNREPESLAGFREHALKLRDEGALHIAVGPMSAQFMPRYPEPALTADAVVAATQAKQPPEPEGDERYVP